jgi:hypothetical protein
MSADRLKELKRGFVSPPEVVIEMDSPKGIYSSA